jgi:bleomycin hydrolase
LTTTNLTLPPPQAFNVRIPHEGTPVTNQRSSGRCWLFATTNVFRIAYMARYNLAEFELSQAYLFFWDKLEKANYFLETVIDLADEPLDGRLMQEVLKAPVNDGGQWDMAANVVEKYGLVPKAVYGDSFHAMNSSAMDRLITTKLRENALRIRKLMKSETATAATLSAVKEKMLKEIHLILTLTLGPPPQPDNAFSWSYTDKSGKYNKIDSLTPLSFAAQLSEPKTLRAMPSGTDITRLFSLVHDPRNDYYTRLTVSHLGNVYGPSGRKIRYVNVPMSVIKSAALAQIRAGIPVFFGSDVGQSSDSKVGVMATGLVDYNAGFNITLGMSKAERLSTHESAMTHAMVLTAVHTEKGSDGKEKTIRWRVENSWSAEAGDKGYWVMSDAWMDEFVYQVVVDPSFVDKKIKAILEGDDEIVLPLWDPMGALA